MFCSIFERSIRIFMDTFPSLSAIEVLKLERVTPVSGVV